MAESSSLQEFSPKIEGPRLTVSVEISAKEFFQYDFAKNEEAKAMVYAKVLEKIPPETELFEAMRLALEEKLERSKFLKQQQKTAWGESRVEGSNKYAFRGFIRKSNGEGLGLYPNAKYDQAQESLHKTGFDGTLDGEKVTHIMPCTIWDMYLFPTSVDFNERHEDISTILVYKNEPFVITSEQDPAKTIFVDLNIAAYGKRSHEISSEDAKKMNYPNLRDNLVGEIQIRWV